MGPPGSRALILRSSEALGKGTIDTIEVGINRG